MPDCTAPIPVDARAGDRRLGLLLHGYGQWLRGGPARHPDYPRQAPDSLGSHPLTAGAARIGYRPVWC
ncbi:hypothetical protein GCM10009789_60600 [Kribbella sancticallisti]|uniref:Alpha/beta hydrolase family protein n=1 Tax=Kribbella sancticallisti TaxID=460087 RepID=A0ABN2E8E0_9ACTN